MHPNVQRVHDILATAVPGTEITTLDDAVHTAPLAAEALGCEVGAIANSLVFMAGDEPVLIMTSGAHRVDLELVARTTGLPPLRRASVDEVRAATGQAIGGVAPTGHPAPLRSFVDVDLAGFPTVWAAAGHPNTIFPLTYAQLVALTGGAEIAVAP